MPNYVIYDANIATGTAAKTHVQLVAPSSRRLKLLRLVISFDGVTAANAPVDVDLVRQTTAGTASAFTPKLLDPGETTPLATAQIGFSGTEPTYTDYMYRLQLTPNGGAFDVPLDDLGIWVATAGRVGVVCTTGTTVNATTSLYYSE